jgi:hypothetical protein
MSVLIAAGWADGARCGAIAIAVDPEFTPLFGS